MLFEKAKKEDIGQLTELRIAYITEDNGKVEEQNLEIIRHDLPDYFRRNLNNTIFGYVARNEKEIVSCALLLVTERPASPMFITGKAGTVLNVYTKPEYRHKGYARKLMYMLLADASDMKLSNVELKATEAGYPLYKSLGFKDAKSRYHQMKWYG